MVATYLLTDIGKLSKESEHLLFHNVIQDTKTIIYPFKTRQIIILGKVTITGDAYRLISKEKISVIYVSSTGSFSSQIDYGLSKNVFLRNKQFLMFNNQDLALKTAKQIVKGKVHNQLEYLKRIARKNESEVLEESICHMQNLFKKVDDCSSLSELRGEEGLSARYYFKLFDINIKPEWAEFKKRSRNPPETNVNATLSFLYGILANKIRLAIEIEGLDSAVGTLHELSYGGNALVYDLMEEFRTPIADVLCCTLFNKGILKSEDFYESSKTINDDLEDDFSSETKAVLLTKEGMKKVIAQFEEKMNVEVFNQQQEKSFTYEEIIKKQVELYRKYVDGEVSEYHCYEIKQ